MVPFQTQGHLNGWIDRLTVADGHFSNPGAPKWMDRLTVVDDSFPDPWAPKYDMI